MNFDSKNFRGLGTAAVEKADRRLILLIYLFMYLFIYLFSKDVYRLKDDQKIWKW
jgi:hypothetical protein